MDSSDEELFTVTQDHNKPLLNTSSSSLITQTSDLSSQDSFKERNYNKHLIKDISVNITRLSNKRILNKQSNSHLVKIKRKRKPRLWKFGRYDRRKKTKKSSSQETVQNKKPIEVTMSEAKMLDDNTPVNFHEQSLEIKEEEESCVAIQQNALQDVQNTQDVRDAQNVQDAQDMQENVENSISSTYEAQNEIEDLCSDKTFICARVLPYEFYKEKNTISSNEVINADYDAPPSSSSNIEITEKDSNIDQIDVSPSLSKNERLKKRLFHEKLRRMAGKLATQKLQKKKFKRKRSSSISSISSISSASFISSISSFELSRRKRCRRILSDESSDNETVVETSIKMTRDDNRNKSRKKMDQEKSQTNIPISREMHINLTRLEQMDDVDVIKWRSSRIKNALKMIESQLVEEQLDKQKQATSKLRRNKMIPSSGCNLSKTGDVHEDLSQMSMVSNTRVEKHNPVRNLTDSLDMVKLRKKYKLFKKPKVLIIKLEALGNSFKNGRYSAIKVDYLTRKYIKFIIRSSSKSRKSSLYGLTHLQRKSMIDDNVEEDNNTNYSTDRQSVNKNFKQLDGNKSPIKDNQVVESSNNETALFSRKFAFTSNQKRHTSLSPKTSPRNKNNNSAKKNYTLMEIWRHAFCTKLTTKKPQEASDSVQSTKTVATSQNLPKKLVDAERKKPVTLAVTSTSSIKDNTPTRSPKKHASPKKKELAHSAERNNTSKLELFTNNTNFSSKARNEETIAKNDLQSKSNTTSKSPRKDATEENIRLDSSLNSNISKKNEERIKEKSFEKPNNLQPSTNDVTPIKMSKTSEVCNSNQLMRKVIQYKCIRCNMSFDSCKSFIKHKATSCNEVTNSLPDNASKCVELTKGEGIIIHKIGQDGRKTSKPSTLQEKSSVNKKSDLRKSARILSNMDKEITSPSRVSSGNKMQSKNLQPQLNKSSPKKTKTSSVKKVTPKSNLNLKSPSGTKLSEVRCQEIYSGKHDNEKQCKVCSRFFQNYMQLFDHMFEHATRTINVPIRNDTPKKINKTKRAEAAAKKTRSSIGKEKGLLENANESNTDQNLATLEVSQRNAVKKKDKTSYLLQAEKKRNAQEIQSKPNELVTNRIPYTERENVCATVLSPTKPIICKCHMPERRTVDGDIQIEIVLVCETCQTLFRRFECFEKHCQRAVNPLCAKNRRRNRTLSKLFCVACQRILNSLQELQIHMVMHSQSRRKNVKLIFRCNICKVIFHTQGPLFNNHFNNHVKNQLFLASRLSFPRTSYVGSKFVETLPAVDNEKQIEVYIEIADYKCKECNMLFTSEQDLKSHETSQCKSAAPPVNDNGSLDDGNTSSGMSEKFLLICGFCNKIFYKRELFQLHSLEHKQKRELHSHYTSVAVTAVTKVFICKVCTTIWKTLKDFETHWLTHDTLQEEYVCSLCENHYDTIDLFQEHAITHRNNPEEQHEPISCKVIYRDSNSETNLQNATVNDDNPPCANLNLSDGKKSSEKINAVDNQIQEEPKSSVQQSSLLKNKQSTRVKTTTLPKLSSVCSAKEMQNIGNDAKQEAIQQKQVASNNKANRATENGNNEKSQKSNDNSEDLEDLSEEEELIIVVSESDESLVSSKIRNTGSKKSDNASPVKRNDTRETQGSATTSDPITLASDKQKQCDASTTLIPVETSSNYASKTSNSNANVNLTTSTKELETNDAKVSQDSEIITVHTNIVNSTATKRKVDPTCKNNADSDSTSSSSKSCGEKIKDTSLPQNVMNAIPKAFLRVKSLAELTNMNSSQDFRCEICSLPFDSLYRLVKHKSMHISTLAQNKQNVDQAYTPDNVQVSGESVLKSSMNTTIQSTAPHPVITSNMPLSDNLVLSDKTPLSSNAVSSSNASLSGVALSVNAPQSGNTFVFSPMLSSDNLPPFSSLNPSGSLYLSGNVHPLNQTINLDNSQQMVGVKPSNQVTMVHNTTANKATNKVPNEIQHYELSWTALNNSNNAPQQKKQEKPIYHQNLPPQVAYSISTTVQPIHQNISTTVQPVHQNINSPVTIRPFIQTTYQVSRPPQPRYPPPLTLLHQPQKQQQQQQQGQQQQLQQGQQQQLQQGQQQQLQQDQQQQLQQGQQQQLQQGQQQQLQQGQQQQQQQQRQQQLQTSISNDIHNYSIILAKESVPYQLTSNNAIPANSTNVMLMTMNTMQQVSQNPDRYICMYCPGFECRSVEASVAHVRSPKHEARSRYNSTPYVPRT